MQAKASQQGQNGHETNGNGTTEEEGFEEDEEDEFTAMREVRIYVGEEQCECERNDFVSDRGHLATSALQPSVAS